MQKAIFAFRLSSDDRLFLEEAYGKKKKEVEGQGFNATYEDRKAIKSLGGFLVHQAIKQTRMETPTTKPTVPPGRAKGKKRKPVKGRKSKRPVRRRG